LSDDLGKVQGRIFGEEFGGNAEGSGDGLVGGKAEQEKDILPERGFNGDDSSILCVWHKGYALSR